MPKTRFTKTQMIAALSGQQSGKPVKDICREYGICKATFYHWKAKYGGIPVDKDKKMKGLEDEISRLRKILSILTLENDEIQRHLENKYSSLTINGYQKFESSIKY